ncbi:MAG: ribonuclease R [Gammaproteobacteria bacterium]|nr:ribonuclease R [Gammaproteobacteria bacterium]
MHKPGKGEPTAAEGIVSPNRAGFGFARVEGIEGGVFLPPREMSGLVQGDRVSLSLHKDAQNRWVGTVKSVLERGLSAFLGVIERQGHELRVRAADRRLAIVCTIPHTGTQGAQPGDWVIADIKRYPAEGVTGEAWVRKRLDPERPLELATEAAIARFDLGQEFSPAALQEAKRFGSHVDPDEAARRVDLRNVPLVTIDGADARDFDDAVYAERDGEDFRLLVAIADVSHYVRPGTMLDTEARARGTSVYFPERVLPMLPTALSNHLCSLEPEVDRLCMVADMRVSERGALKGWRVYPAVMRSAARLTYDAAYALLFTRDAAARAALGALVGKLEPLVEVYQALLKARARRGALEFDAPEAGFVFSKEQQVRAIEFKSRNEAHKLIEECMVLANVAVAKELKRLHMPALYRVHQPPEQRKLDNLKATLHVLGIELQLPEEIRTRDLAGIAPRVRDGELRPFVETLVVRSLSQAVYQPGNIGHFGLALPDYAHFTSPIRRYPDLLVHRALRAGLALAPRESSADQTALEPIGADLSRLEKRADEADRYVESFLKCVYLRDRVGQSFEGLITTVVEFGCFVQLLGVGADGLLHLTALRDDDYAMTRDGGQWQGRRSGRKFGPGMRVRVMVTAVNPVEGMIDLELAAE